MNRKPFPTMWFTAAIVTLLAIISIDSGTHGAPQPRPQSALYTEKIAQTYSDGVPNNTNAQSPYKDGVREDQNQTSDFFAFPADPSTIDSKQNARNRTPVYIPNRCQENEILYPGDQEHDWVCDCKPTFVYYPPERKCFQMFTTGYCEPGFIIRLQKGAKQPVCEPNECAGRASPGVNQTLVMFRGDCVQLNEYHDMCTVGDIRRVIGVDEKTHDLDCLNISTVKDFDDHVNRVPGTGSRAQQGYNAPSITSSTGSRLFAATERGERDFQ